MKKVLLIIVLILSVLVTVGCGGDSVDNPKFHENEKVSLLDFEINIQMGVEYGERCAMFTYTNNSEYTITDFELTLKPKDNLTNQQIEELYALVQADHGASEEEMDELKELGLKAITIKLSFYGNVEAGASSEGETVDWKSYYTVTSLDYQEYYEEDFLEFSYIDENGEEVSVIFDYINKTYTHD